MNEPIQDGEKLFYTIGDVAQLLGVKPYVLRYWETEFRILNPQKTPTGQRAYRKKDIEAALTIRRLLYDEKYTIEGARQKVDEHRKGGDLKVMARGALAVQSLESLESDLKELIGLLGSRNLAD